MLCLYFHLFAYNHWFIVAQVLSAFWLVFAWECVHRVIPNSWLNSCVFISLYIHLYLYIPPSIVFCYKSFSCAMLSPRGSGLQDHSKIVLCSHLAWWCFVLFFKLLTVYWWGLNQLLHLQRTQLAFARLSVCAAGSPCISNCRMGAIMIFTYWRLCEH